jgi:outer membrane protein TolC
LALNLLPVAVAAQAPPTGLQNPLPAPAFPLPKGDRAVKSSPTAKDLKAYLAKGTLDIQDVVAIALATNRTLATQVEAYLEAHGNTIAARSGLGPKVNAGYTYTGYNEGQTANLGGQSVSLQEQYQNQVTASLSVPIDINGELTAATNQAKYQELAARIDINRARNEVVLNAKSAFYTVLRAQALVKVAEDALQNAVDRLADARIRLKAGTVAKYDVTTAESDVA